MKYLHLIWAALFRRKTRTILTLISIITAFLLFGMLDAVRISFDEAGKSANGAERLQTGSRLSFIETLPQSLGRADRTVARASRRWRTRTGSAAPTRIRTTRSSASR